MRIAIIGYGKMGQAIERIAIDQKYQIVCIINEQNPIENLLEGRPDVAIEFTQPESAFKNIQFCIQNQIPVISGTTGWLDKYDQAIELCKKEKGTFLYASNFSVGVNLFFELNKWLAQKLDKHSFASSIEEIHHTEKKDSPSGTAITLAEGILEKQQGLNEWINEETTDHNKIGIVSKRIPNVPGTHTVSYSSMLETISISHEAHDRNVFAEGAVRVANWIYNKKGVFNMSDFINDDK